MQTLLEFMNRDRLRKYKTKPEYHYFPKDKSDLIEIIGQLIKKRGLEADLNDIDTSKIDDMWGLFGSDGDFDKFNGDISQWDVSKVKNMRKMFYESEFTGDISQWNVSNVENMARMFMYSKFDGNIEGWKVDDKCNTNAMFMKCPLENHPPKWY